MSEQEKKMIPDNQSLSKRSSEIEKDLEIMPPQPDASMSMIRGQIREALLKVDPIQAKIWDELNGIVDTNQVILLNLKQAQTHLQKANLDYYSRQAKMDEVLKALIEKGEEYLPAYLTAREGYEKELREHRAHLIKLMEIVGKLAKEYRSCVQQKKTTIPISQFIQWKMAVEASIHRNVHNKEELERLADDIIDAGRALFPSNAGDDV